MYQRNNWHHPFGLHFLDPQVYLQVLRGTTQGLAASLARPRPTGNFTDIYAQGEWGTSDPGVSSAQLARYGQEFHLVFRPFSSLR